MIENYMFPGQQNSIQLWQQAKIQQKMAENQLEIDKEMAKVCIREESKLRIYDRKMAIRQMEEERRRSTYEEIFLDRDGNVLVMTRNLSIQAQPRQITDMKSPKIFIAERASGRVRKVFILNCWVREAERLIFLDAKKVENGAYLLGKLAEAGVSVLVTSARAKDYVKQLFALLVRNSVVVNIPDKEGWMMTDEGKFSFVDESRMTWEEIVKKI